MSAALYRHCSRCGSGDMLPRSAREIVCTPCGYRHFLTPIPAACLLLLDEEGRLLLARRAHEPSLGKWGVPGGVIEPGETAEAAAARELLEEVGLTLDPGAFDYFATFANEYLFQDFPWPTLDIYFVARVTALSQPLRPDPAEVSETWWCPLPEIPMPEIAFRSIREAVDRLRR